MTRAPLARGCLVASLVALTLGAGQPAPATSTVPPGSDIWIASLNVKGDTVSVRMPANATARPGYDNQPWFLPDGDALLYTSRRGTQTDIYELTLDPHGERQVTDTPDSEYSPMLTPDATAISVIRVEADSTQRLWRFPLNGNGRPRVILADVKPVGYHAWGNETTLALFVLGEPATLQIASTTSGHGDVLARDIGRSLHLMPDGRAFSYTERTGERQFTLKRVDLATRELATLVPLPAGAQDYAWMPNGMAITSSDDRLLVWRRGWTEWREAGFTKPAGMGAISRLAVSRTGDRLAIVAAER